MLQSSNDAHIGFFSSAQDTAEVYEIVLSGWGNTRSTIRESNQGARPPTQHTAWGVLCMSWNVELAFRVMKL